MDGRYRDLVSLIEFGNEAYVVTPFTSDYDNILLSISLIGDPIGREALLLGRADLDLLAAKRGEQRA